MKRLVKVILLFTMIMSLSGCGEKQKEDWLSGKGLSITKKSDFKEFESTTYDQSDKENYHTNGEVKIPTKIEIDETKEECEGGRKKVRLTAELDLSVNEDDGLYWYITAIDRYTGTEFYSPVTDKRDFILSIDVDGQKIDIKAQSFTKPTDYPKVSVIIVVDCPEDYDGVVFAVGYASVEAAEEYRESEITGRIRTLDEVPFWQEKSDKYYYFSYDDK